MADKAHEWTDRRILEIDKSLQELYGKAKDEMARFIENALSKADELYEDYDADDVLMVMLQLGVDESLAYQLAEMAVETDAEAIRMVNSNSSDIYRKNAGYMLLVLVGMFDLLDVHEFEVPPAMPRMRIDRERDFEWNLKRMRSAIRGMRAGEMPSKQSVRAASSVMDSDMRVAMRSARTMATRTESLGRIDAMREAIRNGAKVEKQWVAVMDDRTRESHRELDGTHVPIDEPFVTISGARLMYPADPDCDEPSEVYNCRCTLVPWEV